MKKKELSFKDTLANSQEKLFLYDNYFKFFINLYKNNLLPNKILLTGQSGIGKSTFAYHFINYILSNNENHSYNIENFEINPLNKSYRLVKQKYHPNFYLIENFSDKQIIDIKQVREMIIYANKTSYEKNLKFILINNAEYLNLSSVNALLKIVEEPSSNTFIIIIQDSSRKMIGTLRSRCIEFKIYFSHLQKNKILTNLLNYHDLTIDINLLKNISSFYDSPGTLLSLAKLIEDDVLDLNKNSLVHIISNLMDYYLKNKNYVNLNLLQNIIELFFSKKLQETQNKNKISLIYSKVLNSLNFSRKYNIDMNNTFYEIKENIIHA